MILLIVFYKLPAAFRGMAASDCDCDCVIVPKALRKPQKISVYGFLLRVRWHVEAVRPLLQIQLKIRRGQMAN